MKKVIYIAVVFLLVFSVGSVFAENIVYFPYGTGLQQGSLEENLLSACEVAGKKFADGYIAQVCFNEGYKSRCIEIFCDNGRRINLKNLGNYSTSRSEWVNPDVKGFPPSVRGSEWVNPDNGNIYRVPRVQKYPAPPVN